MVKYDQTHKHTDTQNRTGEPLREEIVIIIIIKKKKNDRTRVQANAN